MNRTDILPSFKGASDWKASGCNVNPARPQLRHSSYIMTLTGRLSGGQSCSRDADRVQGKRTHGKRSSIKGLRNEQKETRGRCGQLPVVLSQSTFATSIVWKT